MVQPGNKPVVFYRRNSEPEPKVVNDLVILKALKHLEAYKFNALAQPLIEHASTLPTGSALDRNHMKALKQLLKDIELAQEINSLRGSTSVQKLREDLERVIQNLTT